MTGGKPREHWSLWGGQKKKPGKTCKSWDGESKPIARVKV